MDILVEWFILTFIFEDDFPCIDSSLQKVRENIFENTTSVTWKQLYWTAQLEKVLECYNVISEEYDENIHNINISELEGHREFIGPINLVGKKTDARCIIN